MKHKIRLILAVLLSLLALTACSTEQDKRAKLLNPDKPITVVVWNYYNGNIKEQFDAMVTTFNETVGIEKGIVIESQSFGDVNQLASAVFDSANKTIGASPMPDVFAAYPENAFRVNQVYGLVDFEQYFTDEELASFRAEFLEEGRFVAKDQLYILPVAKSTENLYINKNFWETFAAENGFTVADLSTWEGLYNVAKVYYEKTGKGFFSIDANANYFIIGAMQLGGELFVYNEDGTAKLNFGKDQAQKIWQYYYTPYIQGYFMKTGRFSSDDAKTGTILAYTGSTAGAAYFPTEVTLSESEIVPIEPLILPYPYFKDGKPYAVQQGAGMCISKSDEAHEYAASIFLKWFVNPSQNLKFAVSTGYLPVNSESLTSEQLNAALESANMTTPSIKASIANTTTMLGFYQFYNAKPFEGSYELRALLETHLYNKIIRDLEQMNAAVKAGGDKKAIAEQLTSEAEFEKWYNQFIASADDILAK